MLLTPQERSRFLRTQSRADWVLVIFLAVLVVSLIVYVVWGEAIQKPIADRAETAVAVFTGISIVAALRQAIRSSRQAEDANYHTTQLLKKDVLFSLYEMYMRRDMHRAIDDAWATIKQDGVGVTNVGDFLGNPDRYQFLKKYLTGPAHERQRELDESRRIVTHFWYLIENLLDQGLVSEQDIFEWLGPPNVIWVLEGLEVVKQNLDMPGVTKTRWPPLRVLDRYYRTKGVNIEVLKNGLIPLARIDKGTIDQIKVL